MNTPIDYPVLMMRRDAVQRFGDYRQQPCMEDYDLLARLSAFSNLKSLRLQYRLQPKQHRRQLRRLRKQLLKALVRFLEQSCGGNRLN